MFKILLENGAALFENGAQHNNDSITNMEKAILRSSALSIRK